LDVTAAQVIDDHGVNFVRDLQQFLNPSIPPILLWELNDFAHSEPPLLLALSAISAHSLIVTKISKIVSIAFGAAAKGHRHRILQYQDFTGCSEAGKQRI
jgi:hypothetical protein